MLTQKTKSKVRSDHDRSAFTLVEMLVSVGIIVLMMTMFTQIFSMATGTISTQRGIAENDQRTRSITTVIKGDLDKRTFRNVIPFHANEDSVLSPTSFVGREGYFYISVNDPNNSTDNVLQFTVRSTVEGRIEDDSPYFGRAERLQTTGNLRLRQNPNQPEADDGSLVINSTSNSQAAEVSYFVRNGNLYRRVLLVRAPLEFRDPNTQPTDRTGTPYFDDPSTNTASQPGFWVHPDVDGVTSSDRYFWRFFDFSARQVIASSPNRTFASFNGIENLNNGLGSAATPGALGHPALRFGHNGDQSTANYGLSREFVNSTLNSTTGITGGDNATIDDSTTPALIRAGSFIGRFTHEETSDFHFRYPQGETDITAATDNHNPMDVSDLVLLRYNESTYEPDSSSAGYTPRMLNPRGIVTVFANGPRRAEDLLLPNVQAFEIELWDERLQRFVQPGHSETINQDIDGDGALDTVLGDYHDRRRTDAQATYGPFGAALPSTQMERRFNRVFDTWHPSVDLDLPLDGTNEQPPFRPLNFYPVRLTGYDYILNGAAAADYPGPHLDNEFSRANPTDASRHAWKGQDLSGGALGQTYRVGDTVFDANTSGHEFYYEVVRIVGGGVTGTTGPDGDSSLPPMDPGSPNGDPDLFQWPQVPGARVVDNNIEWECKSNLRPLKMIRITVRFVDVSTDQLRQVTLVESFVD